MSWVLGKGLRERVFRNTPHKILRTGSQYYVLVVVYRRVMGFLIAQELTTVIQS